MSICLIAREVYRCQSRVHHLEDQITCATPQDEEALQEELRKARAELKVARNLLEGRKITSASQKSFSPFSRQNK